MKTTKMVRIPYMSMECYNSPNICIYLNSSIIPSTQVGRYLSSTVQKRKQISRSTELCTVPRQKYCWPLTFSPSNLSCFPQWLFLTPGRSSSVVLSPFILPLWRGTRKKREGPLSCVYVCGGKHSEGTLLLLCIFPSFVPNVLVLTRAHNPSMMEAWITCGFV